MIHHYVIKFVSDLRVATSLVLCTLVSSTYKTDRHDLTEILLEVMLKTISQTYMYIVFIQSMFQVGAFKMKLT